MIKETKLSLILIIAVLFTSCFKTEIPPPLMFDEEANMTIAEFQKLHTLDHIDYVTLIEDDIIITGLVTSTDKYGSCYKEIFFQDSTGGISLRINNSSYYNKYRIGQRIFVKAKGLYLGNYVSGNRTGFYQIGLYGNKNGGMEYISSQKENTHIFRHDVPQTPPPPKSILNTNQIDKNIGGDYHTLVKLVNCYLDSANGTNKYFKLPSPESTLTTISQNISFNNGTEKIQARISMYCSFANDIMPKGALNITGILTMFDKTPQLIIRSVDDVKEYSIEKTLKSFDMNSDPFKQGWKNEPKSGTASWAYYSENKHVRISADSGVETECWFVSPKLNFSEEKDVALAFNYRLPNGTGENAQVLYSVDGTNWISFDYTIQKADKDMTVYVKIKDNLASNPNLQIAFKYKTTAVFPMWAINNISFKANVTM